MKTMMLLATVGIVSAVSPLRAGEATAPLLETKTHFSEAKSRWFDGADFRITSGQVSELVRVLDGRQQTALLSANGKFTLQTTEFEVRGSDLVVYPLFHAIEFAAGTLTMRKGPEVIMTKDIPPPSTTSSYECRGGIIYENGVRTGFNSVSSCERSTLVMMQCTGGSGMRTIKVTNSGICLQ